ncbi:MAG TPA: cellulase N-terminal Ig-like domain-containing protein [Candidatus Goldiibacteriota bacterium]|nr:cellulase N-terminal Ig-like domain-containing protein [Candidatus Goldiibacteriota bacterium]
MKEILPALLAVFILGDVAISAVNEEIRINMLGYLPAGQKHFVVTQKAANFSVKSVETGKAVFYGELKLYF